VKVVYVQTVDDNASLSYVYTAYVDDREAPDVQSTWLPVVRIFAWFPRTQNVTGRWRCVLWDDAFTQPQESVVVGWTDLDKCDTFTE